MSVIALPRKGQATEIVAAAGGTAVAPDPTETLFSSEEARHYYMKICMQLNIHANTSFLRQLQSESVVIAFKNDYLGENGIAAITATLQRCAIHVLGLTHCRLQVEDIKHICDAFVAHPTLERLDLRGNPITVMGGKRILNLVCRNSHITEVELDDDAPNRDVIRQRCHQNMQGAMTTRYCAACDKPVASGRDGCAANPSLPGPSVVFSILHSHFTLTMKQHITAVELYTFFALLQKVCDVSNGVFFVCSEECATKITLDLLSYANYARTNVFGDGSVSDPSLSLRCPFPQRANRKWQIPTLAIIKKFRQEFLGKGSDGKFEDRVASKDSFAEILDEKLGNINPQPKSVDGVCPLCGYAFAYTNVEHVASALLTLFLHDLDRYLEKYQSVLSASVFLRICRTMAQYANLSACCSRKCLRQISRFALYGFRGVIRSFSTKNEPFLSSKLSLSSSKGQELPECSFSILDMSSLTVYDVGEEEISCALTVASAMEDIERVPIDPYFIYAAGRHLARQPRGSVGMTLQSACEVVCTFGCLEAAASPFPRGPSSSFSSEVVGDWEAWGRGGRDIAAILRGVFARRRGGVYAVDGPHGNLFDNIRATLWTFKRQRRSILVVIKASPSWFNLSNGVIAGESTAPRGGFYTTVKIIGQSVLSNEPHLILQGHFGSRVGYRGFFYITKNLFNRFTTGNAYIFLDRNSFVNLSRGSMPPLPSVGLAREVVSPCARELFDQLNSDATGLNKVFCSLLNCSLKGSSSNLTANQMHCVGAVLRRLPPILYFLRESERQSGAVFAVLQHSIAKFVAAFLSQTRPAMSTSELIFLLSEVFGADVCRWLCSALKNFSDRSISCPLPEDTMERTHTPLLSVLSVDRSRLHSHENWFSIPLLPPATSEQEEPVSLSTTLINKILPYNGPQRQDTKLDSLCAYSDRRLSTKPPPRCPLEDLIGKQEEVASEELSFDCFGKRWSAFHLCDDDGTVSPLIVCFLGNAVCLYNLATSRVVRPLEKIKPYSTLLGAFPFMYGVDCAFNHPLRPCEVFLFSSGMVAIWDAAKRKCLLGPCCYHKYQPLTHLPEIFTRVESGGIPAALPFPGTPLVAFFSRSQEYVVYDLEKGEVRFLGSVSSALKDAPFLSEEKLLRSMGMGSQQKAQQNMCDASSDVSGVNKHRYLRNPPFGKEIMNRFITGGIPMAVLQEHPNGVGHGKASSEVCTSNGVYTVLLPMTCGEVIIMRVDSSAVNVDHWLSISSVIPMRDSKFARLPLSFRQVALEALSQACSAVVEHKVRTNPQLISLEPYQPRAAELTTSIDFDSHDLPSFDVDASSVKTKSYSTNLGVVVTAHQWTPTSHTMLNTFPNSFMTLSSPIASEQIGKNVTGNKEEVCYYYYHHQDAQEEPDTVAPSSTSKSWILFDFGADQAEFFGAVIIVTNAFFDPISNFSDLPFVGGSDVKLFVESSEGGILFQRVAFDFTVRGHLVFASWKETCPMRYWRIGLDTNVDSPTVAQLGDFGIARVLWYRAVWQPTLCELSALEAFTPQEEEDAPEVSIVAPCVVGKPENILSCSAASTVLAAPTSHGWWERRAVLPLLRPDDVGVASTALFFCGGCFSEMDLNRYEVMGNRSVALRRHPAFNKMPYPFHTGLDAIFYTHLLKYSARIVTLLRDGFRLHWNLQEGRAEGPVVCWQEAEEFYGIPVDLEKDLVHITNVWRVPQEIRVIYRTQSSANALSTLCWHVDRRVVTSGPMPLDQNPHLNCPELGDKHISCIFSTPQSPNSFVIFAEDLVAHHPLPYTVSSSASWMVSTIPLSRAFHRLQYALPAWGLRRRDAVVMVDLRSHPLLILGVELVCRRVDANRLWIVEYSDDAIYWRTASRHRQSSLFARTTWSPTCVKGVSHRFWRLSTVCDASSPDQDTPAEPTKKEDQKVIFYSSIRLLVVPHTTCRVLPTRMSTSGQLISSARELFIEAPCSGFVAFGANPDAVVENTTKPHYILIDYGSNAPVSFSGLSIMRRLHNQEADGSSNSLLRHSQLLVEVLCSDDTVTWSRCGFFSSPFESLKVFWDTTEVLGSSRFWKLEFKVASALVIEKLMFYVAQCPLLKLESSDHSHAIPCTSLLWVSACAEPSYSDTDMAATENHGYHRLSTSVSNSVVLDMTSFSILENAICGVELQCAKTDAMLVGFCVECSQDQVKWLSLSYIDISLRQLVSAACWQAVGHYRFWRLRITSTSHPNGFMLLKRVRWLTSKFVLYKVIPSDQEKLVENADGVQETVLQLQLSRPEAMMGVKVSDLPPGSECVVERLDLDGITWREVSRIASQDPLMPTNVLKGWNSGPPSSSWRLRRIGRGEYVNSFNAPLLDDGAEELVSPLANREATEQEICMSVEWLGVGREEPFRVDVNAIQGMTSSCDGFEEIYPLDELCARSMGASVSPFPDQVILRSLPCMDHEGNPTKNEPTIGWSFSSPLHLDSVCVYARLSAPDMRSSLQSQGEAAAEDLSPRPTAKQRSRASSLRRINPLKKRVGGKAKGPHASSDGAARARFLSLVVESCHNGVDFVPLAEAALSDGLVALSWKHPGESFRHWRLRLRHIPSGTTVDVSRVQWFALRGVGSAFVEQMQGLRLAMSNTAYATWQAEAFNHEEEFCAQCVSGYTQAKGKASGMLEAGEIDKFGNIAECVWSLKKKYERFIIRKRKEIIAGSLLSPRSLPLSVRSVIPDMTNLESDLNYILYCSSENYSCNFGHLVELIGQPMNLGSTFTFCKKNTWFYPCLSITGKLQGLFHGVEGLSVNYSVYWSLSLELQRDMGQIKNPSINALSPHLASPVISLYMNGSQCRRAIHSMGLLPLYHAGFRAPPTSGTHSDGNSVIICYALNEVVFSDKYPLKVVGSSSGKSISSPFPYRIFYGVNVIQRMALASCPIPILDMLWRIYPQPVLDQCSALMTFNTPSANSQTAVIRFTLPGSEARLLNAYGITVDSIEFELSMRLNSPSSSNIPRPSSSNSSRPLSGKSNTPHRRDVYNHRLLSSSLTSKMNEGVEFEVNFITHGARYYFNTAPPATLRPPTSSDEKEEEGKSFLVSFVGSLSSTPALLTLRGGVSSGCIPCQFIPDAYIAYISILGTAAAARDVGFDDSALALVSPYAIDYVTLSGRLFLPNGKNYTCSYDLPPGVRWDKWREMAVEFVQAPLEEVLRFSENFFDASNGDESQQTNTHRDKYWSFISNLNIRISMKVVVDAVKHELRGAGSAECNGEFSQDLVAVINRGGFRFSGTLPFVRLGLILLEGYPGSDNALFFDLMCDRAVGDVQLRAVGVSSLGTTMAPIPTHIEASSERGVLLLASTYVFDLSIEVSNGEEILLSTSCGFIAQVNIHKELLFSEIEAQLRAKPIVASLCAHGMPFCLKLHGLVAEPLFLSSSLQTLERTQRWLCFSLHGVFFGGSFDVVSSWVLEDMSPSSLHTACQAVVVQIMEQCEESLWSSYANMVGCIQLEDSEKEESILNMGLREDKKMPISERHLASSQGCFMSRWIEQECELFEEDLE
ncbi:unnamed protein product [Phytomonas sp. EM1]|nr:unnamed protein product [Phytomonas sp. EM1]|eukprot:CCW61597.1 unnamed protein product [Phytomonas sp. isolate EM1]